MAKKVLSLLARELGLLDEALAAFDGDSTAQACLLATKVEHKKDAAKAYSALEALLKQERSQREIIEISCEMGRAKLASGQPEVAAKFMRSIYGKAHELSKVTADSTITIYPAYCQALIYLAQKKYTLAQALSNSVVAAIDKLAPVQHGEFQWLLAGALLCAARAAAGESLSRPAGRSIDRLIELLPELSKQYGLAYEDTLSYAEILKLAAIAGIETAEWGKAAVYSKQWLHIIESKHGRSTAATIEPLCYLASALEHFDRKKGAECLDRALHIVAHVVEEEPFEAKPGGGQQAIKMSVKEYQLLNQLADAYLMQGRLVDSLKLYPSSMRARYTSYVSSAINLTDTVVQGIDKLKKYYATKNAADDIDK